MKNIPEEDIQRLLKEVCTHFDKEDSAIRERQIKTWRWLKLLWEGIHRTWYSEVAHDWRIYDESQQSSDTEQAFYDKPINVFRAYLESIIAALSITVPPVKCFPDDADNTLDLSTARTGDKIAQLIYRHNDVPLVWLHGLFTSFTEGLTGCYSYPKTDKKYGTYNKRHYEDVNERHEYVKCPECGYEIEDTVLTPELQAIRSKVKLEEDKYNPGPDDVSVQDEIQNNPELEECPSCLAMIAPEITQETLVVTRLVGITSEPKTRICLEVYGGLYIKVANYAKQQADTPYLIFSYETHFANVVEKFDHLHGKKAEIFKKKIKQSGGPTDPYEQWGRLSPQYQGDYPLNCVTVRNVWLRPAAFNILTEKEDIDRLRKLYPNGVKVVLVNDCFGEAVNESLDDCWTLTYNPLADFLHHEPLGLLLTSIQEITNDLISLTLQTIEHGIPQTFADPTVVSFNAYRQMETVPGALIEATPRSGKAVGDAFHEVKTASLSPEVMPFANNIQSLAQLVSGALPSLFGGQIQGSETASEYSMSRAQALQRLQTTWKMLTIWWKTIFGKVIPMFISELKDDERDVQLDTDGNFFNVFIRKAELEGKIGKIELEANENLPLTFNQRKDVWMQLMQNANPQILQLIAAPENLPILREAIGLTDLYIPGEDDREKQYEEIKLLLNSEPMETGDPLNPAVPSVEIDPDYDNHEIQFEIVRKWAISEAGRQAKIDNPVGYQNVLLHGKLHLAEMQMAMQAQAEAAMMEEEGKGATPSAKPNPKAQEAPIMGDENVEAIH